MCNLLSDGELTKGSRYVCDQKRQRVNCELKIPPALCSSRRSIPNHRLYLQIVKNGRREETLKIPPQRAEEGAAAADKRPNARVVLSE